MFKADGLYRPVCHLLATFSPLPVPRAGRAAPSFRSRSRPFFQSGREVFSGHAFRIGRNRFRRSGCDDFPAVRTASRPHVDDVVGILYHIQIMFDHDYGRAVSDKGRKYVQKRLDIQGMQADGGFVEYEDGTGSAVFPISLASFRRCASPPESPGVSSPSVR